MMKAIYLIFFSFIFTSLVSAEEYKESDADKSADYENVTLDKQDKDQADSEEDKKDFPKQGVLSTNGNIGFGSVAINQPWQGPVKGSVTKIGNDWEVSANNTDEEDTYQLNLVLEQFTKSGNNIRIAKSNPLTVKLSPGESKQQSFRGANNTIGARLVVRSWKITN